MGAFTVVERECRFSEICAPEDEGMATFTVVEREGRFSEICERIPGSTAYLLLSKPRFFACG